MEMGENDKALKYAHLHYKTAQEIGIIFEIGISSDYLYNLYFKAKNFDKALEYYEISIRANDSVDKSTYSEALIEEELKYEYEKKAMADSIFNAEEQKVQLAIQSQKEAELKEGRNLFYGILVILFILVIFSVIIWFRFQKSQELKEYIHIQKDKMDNAYKELIEKNKEVEKKTLEILDSINYAKYIQRSLMPEDEKLKMFFKDHFVFNWPKDIVGGDFYWFKSFGDKSIIVAADCTGHGVPGGFITMLGSLLISSSIGDELKDPNEILHELNKELVTSLKQHEKDAVQDGMDMAICMVDKKNNLIKFSGSRNGLYIVNGDTIDTYKGDILPVGGFYTKKEKLKERHYELNEIKLKKGDWVFMYTDGFYDQFGGPKNKSMGSTRFKEILKESVKHNKTTAPDYKDYFFNWMGNHQQIDDVLIIGFTV